MGRIAIKRLHPFLMHTPEKTQHLTENESGWHYGIGPLPCGCSSAPQSSAPVPMPRLRPGLAPLWRRCCSRSRTNLGRLAKVGPCCVSPTASKDRQTCRVVNGIPHSHPMGFEGLEMLEITRELSTSVIHFQVFPAHLNNYDSRRV